jgi:hypothetical protein
MIPAGAKKGDNASPGKKSLPAAAVNDNVSAR